MYLFSPYKNGKDEIYFSVHQKRSKPFFPHELKKKTIPNSYRKQKGKKKISRRRYI